MPDRSMSSGLLGVGLAFHQRRAAVCNLRDAGRKGQCQFPTAARTAVTGLGEAIHHLQGQINVEQAEDMTMPCGSPALMLPSLKSSMPTLSAALQDSCQRQWSISRNHYSAKLTFSINTLAGRHDPEHCQQHLIAYGLLSLSKLATYEPLLSTGTRNM